MRYVFINVIAAGQVDFKSPYTAAHQPSIRECAMIGTDSEDDSFRLEMTEPSGFNLNVYSNLIGAGAVVVGHSVEFHHGYLRAAMIPMGLDPCDNRVKTICTMLSLADVGVKSGGRKGWPKFQEACDYFHITRAGTESAEDNARCLLQVFRGMENIGVVPEVRVWKER
jgi:hypothetical protein